MGTAALVLVLWTGFGHLDAEASESALSLSPGGSSVSSIPAACP
jgi:hypothetical protein